MADLDIQDFLDASRDAATRSRNAIYAIVIVTIVVFAGLLNSLQANWMKGRIADLRDPCGNYATKVLGACDQQHLNPGHTEVIIEFRRALLRSYVENTYSVRAPFFGVSFDINYLGIFSGISLCILMLLLRFCLSRENDNLRLGFIDAFKEGKAEAYYKLLSMSLVLTVPKSDYLTVSWLLRSGPKLIIILPAIVNTAVVLHDVATSDIAKALSEVHFFIVFSCELFFGSLLYFLTYSVVVRLRRLDTYWDEQWINVRR